MKIGFDVSDLVAGQADGTTRYTLELARRFSGMSEDEWLYFASGKVNENYQLPITNVQFKISRWPKYWTQTRLPFDLFRYRPDVMFMSIQQLPYLRPRRMKTVCVIHDLAWMKYGEQTAYKDWLLQQLFTAYAARHADALICVSQATADDVKKYYGRSENVHVIHHGLNHEQFSMVDNPEKYPDLDSGYILYVGQIQPRKNIVRLVEAFEKLGGDRNLVIAGSHGWLNKDIFKRIENSLARESIKVLGRVDDDMLPTLYRNAGVFVLPSLYEGFGMPILEAMACGTPVVTSNVSCMPEVAGDATVLVDPESVDSMASGIAEAFEKRDELVAKGINRASEFTWERTARETLNVINSV